jgi:hypothetical protein
MSVGDQTCRLRSAATVPFATAPDSAWSIAEAGTEQPVEVRNIRKTNLQRDVGNSACIVERPGKQRESSLQSQLVDVCGE